MWISSAIQESSGGINVASLVASAVVGAIFGGVSGILTARWTGYWGERGRQRASDDKQRRDLEKQEREEADRLAEVEESTARQRENSQREMEKLSQERVGACFLHRTSPTDPGMVGRVIGLDARHPGLKVRVTWSSPPGRNSTEHDCQVDTPVTMDWDNLVMSHTAQRQWTARNILDSYDDADGWVQYERITGPPSDA